MVLAPLNNCQIVALLDWHREDNINYRSRKNLQIKRFLEIKYYVYYYIIFSKTKYKNTHNINCLLLALLCSIFYHLQ